MHSKENKLREMDFEKPHKKIRAVVFFITITLIIFLLKINK